MIKRSMSRNTRAKGIRVRHIVQILLLLGVCIWLIYQVKHSHDKKKALNDNDGDEKSSEKMQNDLGFLKFGRKDLDPWVEEARTSEKHKEEAEEVEDENGGEDEERKHDEEEEEAKHEEEENREEEEAKHEEEENREEEETKPEEAENEGRGGGDDEIDENDQENEENADFIDDEKEKDNVEGETETDEKGDQDDETGDKDDGEEEISSEDNESDEKTHEAREEHYKGDDASSAVTHDTRFSNAESEETNLDSNNLEHEEEPSEETRQVHDSSRIMEEEEGTDKTTKDGNLADAVDLDRSKATQSNEQEDPHANDADQVKTEASIGQTIYNSTETQNHTVNASTDGSTGNDLVWESAYSNSNLTISLRDENENGNMEASLKSSNDTESVQPEESGVTEEATDRANGDENAAEEDPIDSSDSDIGHELEENRMDFDTLPEIRTEINNSDEIAAE